MFTQDYTVHLEQFEGPLDLLLHLIRRAELDITAISIASITEQYLDHIRHIERVDVESAGDFLVTAATLLEVKSRLVSPAPQGEDNPAASLAAAADNDDPTNPAGELIRQLLAYKAYRDAADALDNRRSEWARRFPASQAQADAGAMEQFLSTVNDLDIEDLQVYDLVEAFQRIIETVQFDRLGAHSVTYDDTPIELHAADLIDRIAREAGPPGSGAAMGLRAVFAGRTRGEMIGLFLATLELVRQRRLSVLQDGDGEVSLSLPSPDAPGPGAEPIGFGAAPETAEVSGESSRPR